MCVEMREDVKVQVKYLADPQYADIISISLP